MADSAKLGSNDASARPSDGREDLMRFTNFYVHCRHEWQDIWSCTCDDRCPICNDEIEPYASREKRDKEPKLHVGTGWLPEQGLPEGTQCVQELRGWPHPRAPQKATRVASDKSLLRNGGNGHRL
jgi:hypothetical protein